MKPLFSRWLPAATLAAWSAILLVFYFSGKIRPLLAPEFRPGVLVAGIVMGLMALVFLFTPADADCCSSAECGHSLSRFPVGKVLTFLILLLPITAAAFFSPEGFSANVVKNRGIITDATLLGAPPRISTAPIEPPLPSAAPAESGANPAPAVAIQPEQKAASDYLERAPDGSILAEVLDLLYAAQDNTLRGDFEGKKIQLTAQLMPETANNASGKRFKAVRMFMTCCAADARPVATLVEAEFPVDYPEMTWLRITGISTFPVENGRRIAVLKAVSIDKTTPPEESMLY